MSILNKIVVLFSLCFLVNTLSAQPFSNASISNVSIINTATYDFSPTFHKDGIVFVSNSEISGKKKIFDKKFNQKTMSLFIARRDVKGILGKPQPFANELVSQVHEGPVTFEKDFKTVYISRNNHKKRKGKAKYAHDDVDYMKIYVSQLGDKGWTVPKKMSLNTEQSDACHPALSPDGNQLFFSSNCPGGFGGMDLYVCNKIGNGWSKPMNLGATVNSDKNDVFPYVHNDGMLYFSSNRTGGEGGLDIYYYKINLDNKFSAEAYFPNNSLNTPLSIGVPSDSIGVPFNSENDDFGFILETDNKSGYFTSNRKGGAGEDDIYFFMLPEKLDKTEQVVAVVEKVNEKVSEKVNEKENEKVNEKVNDSPTVAKANNTPIDIKPAIPAPLPVVNTPAVAKIETVKETVFQISNIYYNFDDAAIRKDAAATLDSLLTILKNFPDMYIELVAHTDSRGSDQYNDILSEKRAKNAANYFIKHGIDPSRLKQVPYGERQLLITKPQSHKHHQLNRRTEVRVIRKL